MALSFITHQHSNYLFWQELSDLGVKHCFTLKPDDMGIKTASNPEKLTLLYEKACRFANCTSERVLFPQQIHGGNVHIVTRETLAIPSLAGEYLPDCDGLITDVPDYTLISQYADCMPISIVDPVKRIIATVHSGWRGTSLHILSTALSTMTDHFGCTSADIHCFFWPSIHQPAFEVDQDVAETFTATFPKYPSEDFISRKGIKHHVDTVYLNTQLALEQGIKKEHIHHSDLCTHQDERFHSYRRDKDSSGRMALIMELK